jgi:hypothetical protein
MYILHAIKKRDIASNAQLVSFKNFMYATRLVRLYRPKPSIKTIEGISGKKSTKKMLSSTRVEIIGLIIFLYNLANQIHT